MPSPQVSSGSEVAKRAAILDAAELLDRGLFNSRAGAIGAALDYLSRAEAAVEGELDDSQRAALLTTTLDCRLARGELADARNVGDRLGAYLESAGLAGATAHYGRGELCAAGNEIDLASAHFARIPRLLDTGEDDPDVIPWRTAAALAAVRQGHRVEGTALAREHLTIAGAAGAAYPIALGLRTLATVDAHTDRGSLLRQALDELDGVPAARLKAQIQTDLAEHGLRLLVHPAEQAADPAEERPEVLVAGVRLGAAQQGQALRGAGAATGEQQQSGEVGLDLRLEPGGRHAVELVEGLPRQRRAVGVRVDGGQGAQAERDRVRRAGLAGQGQVLAGERRPLDAVPEAYGGQGLSLIHI